MGTELQSTDKGAGSEILRLENVWNAGQRARLKLVCFALAMRVNLLFISEGQSSSRESIDYGSFESEQGGEQGRIGLFLGWFSRLQTEV